MSKETRFTVQTVVALTLTFALGVIATRVLTLAPEAVHIVLRLNHPVCDSMGQVPTWSSPQVVMPQVADGVDHGAPWMSPAHVPMDSFDCEVRNGVLSDYDPASAYMRYLSLGDTVLAQEAAAREARLNLDALTGVAYEKPDACYAAALKKRVKHDYGQTLAAAIWWSRTAGDSKEEILRHLEGVSLLLKVDDRKQEALMVLMAMISMQQEGHDVLSGATGERIYSLSDPI